jgi:hypothetical protein
MNKGKQSASGKQASAVIALGRKCARMAYPNPQRQGCPDPSTLRAMAYRDGRYSLTDLPISHVVTCSPCFSQYLRFRQRLVLVTTVKITTAFLAVFVVVFASIKLARHDTANLAQPAVAEKSVPHSPAPNLGERPVPAIPLAMEVNLQSFSPLRGDSPENAPQKIQLPPKALRICFLLPIGMEPGRYTVRLSDAQGISVLEQPVMARIAGGAASLVIDVDLTKAVVKTEMTLMIKPPGLSWRKYPIVVG